MQKQLRTLCVDDNAMNLRILDRTLRHHFPDLVDHDALLHAADGFQALAHYKQHAQQLDLVLLDIDMPGISGVQVAEQIRATPEGAALVIIACTTSDTPAARARYAAAGIDGCVCKPIDLRELDGALRLGIQLRRPDLRIVEETVRLEQEQPKDVQTLQSPYALRVRHFSLQEDALPTLRQVTLAKQQQQTGLPPHIGILLTGVPEEMQGIRTSACSRPPACPIGRRHSMCVEHPFKLSPVRVCIEPQARPRLCQMPSSASHPECAVPAMTDDSTASSPATSTTSETRYFMRPLTASTTSSQESLPLLDRTQSAAAAYSVVGQSTLDRFASAAKRRLPLRTRTPEILMQPAAQVAAK
ncbi:CheY-like superfamily [Protomyces lactucae-debilis]|uniref:Stress response regulator protein 1 n=1 Tax=Protomyces lactucae-debilis TaxID=2754530 RepID=A0A1Y2FDG4_PROLT|nr:CheY-like superfamily [Protomyces lactucae-debilis]ORY81960.1 CheY-like superfamily [Protomyces lactucae-debilis]